MYLKSLGKHVTLETNSYYNINHLRMYDDFKRLTK